MRFFQNKLHITTFESFSDPIAHAALYLYSFLQNLANTANCIKNSTAKQNTKNSCPLLTYPYFRIFHIFLAQLLRSFSWGIVFVVAKSCGLKLVRWMQWWLLGTAAAQTQRNISTINGIKYNCQWQFCVADILILRYPLNTQTHRI